VVEGQSQPVEAAADDISQLLCAWSGGNQSALERLAPIVYEELRVLARRYMKRERGVQHVSLEEAALIGGDGGDQDADLVALDDAMNALARIDPRKVQVVELRFFGGLSVEETAEVLKISPVTVKRDWRGAKAWLYRELNRATA